MPRRPIRRAQLIAPFGPGAMVVTSDGTSLIGAGLDHWYESEKSGQGPIVQGEFQFSEWRLERELGVDYFCLPPDYRRRRNLWDSEGQLNIGLTVPYLRFPRWHVCPNQKCNRLQDFPLVMRDSPRCPRCEPSSVRKGRKSPILVQVRFIAMCDRGHIQDFPWREWVHQTPFPDCDKPMKLLATGGASLAATKAVCECERSRTLEQITEADPPISSDPSTYLTRQLSPGQEFRCQGSRPWLGEEEGGGCGRPLRGSLRGATNVYFAQVRSAIYLPRGSEKETQALFELLETPKLKAFMELSRSAGQSAQPQDLRLQYEQVLRPFSDQQITAALESLSGVKTQKNDLVIPSDDQETAFRRDEFATLRTDRRDEQLRTRPLPPSAYDPSVAEYLSRITLVETLRETRALAGFTRVFPENEESLEERKLALWRVPPEQPRRWLPAYIVHGEGIYIELNEDRLRVWEQQVEKIGRLRNLAERYRTVQEVRRLRVKPITPRLVMLHTLAHVLINQLTFDCGYGTASLRERLYVSVEDTAPMAAILLYTAAGDAEGTMGGLVRMGKPGNLEAVIRQSIRGARWCSADPVCMELGVSGQGPDSCNLAACHNCALVPETSCEEFNRLLDRGLLIGTPENPDLGFFEAMAD